MVRLHPARPASSNDLSKRRLIVQEYLRRVSKPANVNSILRFGRLTLQCSRRRFSEQDFVVAGEQARIEHAEAGGDVSHGIEPGLRAQQRRANLVKLPDLQ